MLAGRRTAAAMGLGTWPFQVLPGCPSRQASVGIGCRAAVWAATIVSDGWTALAAELMEEGPVRTERLLLERSTAPHLVLWPQLD